MLALPLTLEASYGAVLERSRSTRLSSGDGRTALLAPPGEEARGALLLRTVLHWIARTTDLGNVGIGIKGSHANCRIQPTILELCQGLAVYTSPSATSTAQTRPIDPAEVAGLCGGLIRQSDGCTWEMGHRTVYEFLAQLEPSDGRLGFFSLRDTARTDVDMATTLLRFLKFEDFNNTLGEVKIEKARRTRRGKSDPLYGYAAAWWPLLSSGHWSSVSSHVLPLFRAPASNNFLQWIMQYCTRHFDNLFESVLIAGPLIRLVDLFTKPYSSPLHVAACLGLPDLCRSLVEAGDYEVGWNHPSGLGSPLYLALLGPQALGLYSSDSPEMTWRLIHSGPHSLQRKATVETLMSLGATVDAVNTRQRFSIASIGILASAVMDEPALFIKLVEKGALLDSFFLKTLKAVRLGKGPDASTPSFANDSPPSASRKRFMNDVFEYLMDRAASVLATGTDPATETILEEMVELAMDQADDLDLPCADVTVRRPISCSDEDYRKLVLKNIERVQPELLQRLMRDLRWDPNACLRDGGGGAGGEEAAGQTVLHLAVEERSEHLIDELLRHGSDHSRRDAKGRTPLLLVETPISLFTLRRYGADVLARDNEGRSLWHVAAANNDVKILEYLLKTSEPGAIDVALQVTSEKGRTPLAEAFVYVRKLVNWRSSSADRHERPAQAALLLLPHCKGGAAYFRSDTPLMHLAAEWGMVELVEGLASASGHALELVDADGRSPLHYLNISATKEFIEVLQTKCGESLPLQANNGMTPAEAVLLNFKLEDSESSSPHTNEHPSFNGKLDKEAFAKLLTPATIQTRDDKDRTLWERFCTDVLLYCK